MYSLPWGDAMKKRILFLFSLVLIFCLSLSQLENAHHTQGRRQLEEALRRTAVSCYATRGFFPPSVEYMVLHYGLQYDQDRFTVRYEAFASNLMPEITVLEN